MKTSDKFKICPSCDGKAPLEVVICPYCAQNFNQPPVAKSSLSASYSPPYSADRVTPSQPESKIAKSKAEPSVDKKEEKSLFLPIALLAIGSNLVILSLLLLILGKDGKLELEWSSSYWMMYALLGVPLALFGYKIAKKES